MTLKTFKYKSSRVRILVHVSPILNKPQKKKWTHLIWQTHTGSHPPPQLKSHAHPRNLKCKCSASKAPQPPPCTPSPYSYRNWRCSHCNSLLKKLVLSIWHRRRTWRCFIRRENLLIRGRWLFSLGVHHVRHSCPSRNNHLSKLSSVLNTQPKIRKLILFSLYNQRPHKFSFLGNSHSKTASS